MIFIHPDIIVPVVAAICATSGICAFVGCFVALRIARGGVQ